MGHFEPEKNAFAQSCRGTNVVKNPKIVTARSMGIGSSKQRSRIITLCWGKHCFGVEPHFARHNIQEGVTMFHV